MKFTEEKLEAAFIELLGKEGLPHYLGNKIARAVDEIFIEEDLFIYLLTKYKSNYLNNCCTNPMHYIK